jgi:UBX domain-containing protein 6
MIIISWLLGEGHRLNEPSQRAVDTSRHGQSSSHLHRAEPGSNLAQQQAAAAAVARLEKRKEPTPQERSAAMIRARALKELELEQQQAAGAVTNQSVTKDEIHIPSQLAVTGVFFKCPLIGN